MIIINICFFIFCFGFVFYFGLNQSCDYKINASKSSDCTSIDTGNSNTLCCWVYDLEIGEVFVRNLIKMMIL